VSEWNFTPRGTEVVEHRYQVAQAAAQRRVGVSRDKWHNGTQLHLIGFTGPDVMDL
jgi:hypothetical protein